ncbi:molybdenum cofactor biosynthesis protein [Candidatus Epulonipiscium fishelsonii]|uniref:Molybdenum cofactor biosynthesis protein n=1 Tax=Candidatus Epulonipiscium fishelsonii TaxID=77094 RepID=A0ACC8XBX2_9FIRM|nr:molybdenum cofactor biosynthesis protein [Epulopiscium sp. SCG-D08WGA-EpuloA1]OON90540.1 MAG: molybdenum cofactor biosynthesis protein [Epulopiscium sp. AS2M-Bin002]
MRAYIITLSDKGYVNEREDISGKVIFEMVTKNGYEVVNNIILPDERTLISNLLKKICDEDEADLILTTGGTGLSKRDVTPEATKDIIEYEVPGIAEAMRYNSLQITKRAMLSRAIAGVRKNTLIINLPGSPKAVKENLEFVIDELSHGLEILKGSASECARK